MVTQTQQPAEEDQPGPSGASSEPVPCRAMEETQAAGGQALGGLEVAGHALRPRKDVCYIESPIRRKFWEQVKRGQETAGGGSGTLNGSQHTPDSQELLATKNSIQDGIRKIAEGIGLSRKSVTSAQKPWSELKKDTKDRKAYAAIQISDAVVSQLAPDAPNELSALMMRKRSGAAWTKEPSEKFLALLENINEQYALANTKLARMETLGLVAPLLQYPELERYMPGLTRYAYTEARRYAKMSKAGLPRPETNVHRERYNRAKVEMFVGFISSSAVISDTPFGQVTVRQSTGIKQDLPNMIRTSINQRIMDQYKSFLKDTKHTDMALSDSTMRRILEACKVIISPAQKIPNLMFSSRFRQPLETLYLGLITSPTTALRASQI